MGMDYIVEPINQCTVKIVGLDFVGVAMCKRETQGDWIDDIVTNIPTPTST